jgi:tripartite-type tricarboxylate transporter receptor subunit TctC
LILAASREATLTLFSFPLSSILRGFAIVSLSCAAASAQDWPARSIKIITPLAAGGAADIVGRTVGDALAANLKQSVIIDNRPGGGGTLAASMVAHAEPDGLTLLLGAAAGMTIGPVLTKSLPYDPINDLTPITLAVELPICLVVNPNLPVQNIAELIAYAKANPGKLSFGSSGPNTTHHLAGELLKVAAGIDMTHVPYRGGSPAMTDLLSGQIPVLFATLSTAMPYIDSGKVRVLGVVEATRSRARPDIPAIGETVNGYAVPSSWLGFIAPGKMPEALTQRINAELIRAIKTPSVVKSLQSGGFEVITSTPAEFVTILKNGMDRYRKITADAGIQPQ